MINLIKNRFFIISSFLFGFFILLSLNSDCNTFYSFCDPLDNTAYYTVPDLPTDKINRDSDKLFSFIFVGNDNKGDYFILYDLISNRSSVDSVWLYSVPYSSDDISVYNCNVIVDKGSFYLYSYKSYFGDSTNTWTMNSYKNGISGFSFSCCSNLSNKQLIYTNKDIHLGLSDNGLSVGEEIFFPSPPNWGLNLMQPLQVEQILPMVNKLTMIVLPIGLAIFSMLLLVYLIASKKWFRT